MRPLVCAVDARPHAVTTLGRGWGRGCGARTLGPDSRGAPSTPRANHATEDRVSSPRIPNPERSGCEGAEDCRYFTYTSTNQNERTQRNLTAVLIIFFSGTGKKKSHLRDVPTF